MVISKYNPAAEKDRPYQTALQRTDLVLETKIRGKPTASIENMKALLEFYEITVRYNVISKRPEIIIPGEEFTPENFEVATIAHIASKVKNANMPTDFFKDYLLAIADLNQYNPVMEWVLSKEWDKKTRIQELCDTVTAKNPEAKDLFIRRWLITAMALISSPGIDSPGCLVFQGRQNLGKTWWFRKLCPVPECIRTDANINPHDRDSVAQVIRYWIVELGEIGSTFRRADIDALKAFITAKTDNIRRPYAATDQIYPRRTALAASTNESIFLHDTTGNRRFMTVECLEINSYHEIDMQQVWAEVFYLIGQGETWQLSERERDLIDYVNEDHVQIEPIEEEIIAYYDWKNLSMQMWKSATQIAKDIGCKVITQKETRVITSVVRRMNNYDDKCEKRDGRGRFLLVPGQKPY